MQARHPIDGRGLVLPSGQIVFPKPTDWVVSRGDQVVDVCNDTELAARYVDVQEGLTLPRSTCARIEAVTGIGTTRTAQELVGAISRLARIEIGKVVVPFTPGQLEEIKHRASKRGLTVTQELERIVERIKDEIFYKS